MGSSRRCSIRYEVGGTNGRARQAEPSESVTGRLSPRHPAVANSDNDPSRAYPAGGRRKLPQMPGNPRKPAGEKPCSSRKSPPTPAQPGTTKTGLSRRRSRVRVPSLPSQKPPGSRRFSRSRAYSSPSANARKTPEPRGSLRCYPLLTDCCAACPNGPIIQIGNGQLRSVQAAQAVVRRGRSAQARVRGKESEGSRKRDRTS